MTKESHTKAGLNKKVITTYKGFDSDFRCRGFQYKVGMEYVHKGPVSACSSGFHACEYPLDVFDYYPPIASRFAVVKQSGGLSRKGVDTKVASRNIRIELEIGIAGLVKAAVEYVSSRCEPLDVSSPASATGYRGAATATDPSGAASATGSWGAASATGPSGAASATGHLGAASATGDRGAASATGYRSAASATGDRSAAEVTGYRGAASTTGELSAASTTGNLSVASATGDRSAAEATGYRGAASATGDRGVASATGGLGAASATGKEGAASATGDLSAALTTGFQGEASATGQHAVALAAGVGNKARGREGCALFLVYRDPDDGSILHAKTLIVGKRGIKPDTWYRLNAEGKVEIAE